MFDKIQIIGDSCTNANKGKRTDGVWTKGWTDGQTDRQTVGQMDRGTGRQTGRKTNVQIDRQTDFDNARQTDVSCRILMILSHDKLRLKLCQAQVQLKLGQIKLS